MTIKVTMFFQAFKYSWSESHYLLGVSSFAAASSPASFLAKDRQDMLGFFANLVNVRLSYVPANRQIFDLPRTAWPPLGACQTGSDTFNEDTTDAPFSSIMVNLQNLAANKNLYLAGIPDDDIVFTPDSPNGIRGQTTFLNGLNQYMAFLTGTSGSGNSWGFRSRLAQPAQPVSLVQTEALYSNNVGVLTQNNPNVPVGAEAYLTGFKVANPRRPNLSGAYIVAAVIPPSSGQASFTTVLYRTTDVDTGNFQQLGSIQPLQFQYLPYQTWRPVRVTHRKRGGSYGLPLGRSRVRR